MKPYTYFIDERLHDLIGQVQQLLILVRPIAEDYNGRRTTPEDRKAFAKTQQALLDMLGLD